MSPNRIVATTVAVVAALFVSGSAVSAQSAWETPMLLAPGSPEGIGVHLVDPEYEGVGALLTWRSAPFPVGVGFRVGLFDGARSDLALSAGVDLGGELHRGDDDAPFDFVWFTGLGVGIDDWTVLSVPLGVSAGWSLGSDDVAFRPYLAPRLTLDAYLGDDDGPGEQRGRDEDLDLDAALELGADVAFSPSFVLRAAVSFGGRDAVSIGIGLPGR